MAITIKSNKPRLMRATAVEINPLNAVTIPEGYRQTISLHIAADGTISTVGENGSLITPPTTISLGNQGDSNVTILHFDTSKIKNFFTPLGNRYQAAIVARDSKGKSQTFEFDGQDFYVSNNITKEFGIHELVYVIWEIEQTSGDTNKENIAGQTEIFTSSIFKGEVKETNFSKINQPVDLFPIDDQSIIKPHIELHYQGAIAEGFNNLLGYKLDRYIRYLIVDGNDAYFDKYSIYFTGAVATAEQTLGFNFIDKKCWVSPTVTANVGKWEVMIISHKNTIERDYVYVSNVFEMEVVDNKLTTEDFAVDDVETVPLQESNALALEDAQEKEILVSDKVSFPDTGYKLQYTGAEVDELLSYTEETYKENIITRVGNLETKTETLITRVNDLEPRVAALETNSATKVELNNAVNFLTPHVGAAAPDSPKQGKVWLNTPAEVASVALYSFLPQNNKARTSEKLLKTIKKIKEN